MESENCVALVTLLVKSVTSLYPGGVAVVSSQDKPPARVVLLKTSGGRKTDLEKTAICG